MSISAPSTPAFFRLFAVVVSMIPVCITMINPNSFFTLVIASMSSSMGTEPSGRHPQLIRQPTAPFSFSFLHTSKSSFGVDTGYIVLRTFPLQCLHFKAQEDPVIEMDGKKALEERKYLVL